MAQLHFLDVPCGTEYATRVALGVLDADGIVVAIDAEP